MPSTGSLSVVLQCDAREQGDDDDGFISSVVIVGINKAMVTMMTTLSVSKKESMRQKESRKVAVKSHQKEMEIKSMMMEMVVVAVAMSRRGERR